MNGYYVIYDKVTGKVIDRYEMELIKNDDNSYLCKECNFIFGKRFIESLVDFDAYHADLHLKVIVETSGA